MLLWLLPCLWQTKHGLKGTLFCPWQVPNTVLCSCRLHTMQWQTQCHRVAFRSLRTRKHDTFDTPVRDKK